MIYEEIKNYCPDNNNGRNYIRERQKYKMERVKEVELMGVAGKNSHDGNDVWGDVNLSDPNIIRGLLRNRMKFDLCYNRESSLFDSGADLSDFKTEVQILYIDLSNLIKRTFENQRILAKTQNQKDKYILQSTIIKLFMQGYNESEIGEQLEYDRSTIFKHLNRICDMLAEENNRMWKQSISKKYDIKKIGE